MLEAKNFFYWLGIFMGLTLILSLMQSFLIPATFAIMLAFMTSPAYRFMIRHKVPSALAIVLLMAFLSFFVYLVAMVIQASLSSLIRAIPRYQETFRQLWGYTFDHFNLADSDGSFIYAGQVTEGLYNLLFSFSNQFLSILSSAMLVLLFYIFFMSETALFGRKFSKAYADSYDKIVGIIGDIGTQIGYYLALKFLVSLITGVTTSAFLLFMGVDFAFVWGVLVFIFNFIPNIGSILAVGFISLFSFLQFFPDFTTPTFVLIGLTLIQILLGNIIEPKLQGDRLDISPFLLLFFFFFWAWLWGAAGMFLAYPLTVVMKVTFQNIPALRPLAVLLGSGQSVVETEDLGEEKK